MKIMKHIFIFLMTFFFNIQCFAWMDNKCLTKTLDNVCIALCYINDNIAITRLHEGKCINDR